MDFVYSDESEQDLLEMLLKQAGPTKNKTIINSDLIEVNDSSNHGIGGEEDEIVQFKSQGQAIEDIEIEEQNIEDMIPTTLQNQGKKQEQSKNLQKRDENIYPSFWTQDLLKTKTIKKQGKKNTNLPKFFVRIFLKYFNQIQKPHDTEAFFNSVNAQFKGRKTNNFKIKDVEKILGSLESNREISRFNRKFLRRVLREELKDEIIMNSYVLANRKTYMMTSKVFALRCMSKSLTARLQFR